jgi:hypothetical protein
MQLWQHSTPSSLTSVHARTQCRPRLGGELAWHKKQDGESSDHQRPSTSCRQPAGEKWRQRSGRDGQRRSERINYRLAYPGATGGRLDHSFLSAQCRAYILLSRAASHSPALGSLSLLVRLLSFHPLSRWGLTRSLWCRASQPRCTAFETPISCGA